MNRRERMYEQIKQHGQNLNAIFHTAFEPVELAKKVHRIEAKAHRMAEDYCNGDIDTDEWQNKKGKSILASLDKILNFSKQDIPVFVNGDPRGYALKIKNKYVRDHNLQIDTDWGGYGIIAPDFDGK